MSEPIEADELVGEVANANFDDERLTNRLAKLVGGLGKDPRRSLPDTFDSADLEAAYRFFSNHRVTPSEILAAHFEATHKRCEQEGVVLVAHDTTTFSYRHDGERQGLGRAHGRKTFSQNFQAHLSLAISADGTRRPLGVAGFKTWTRGELRSGTEYQRWE
jgi:hypothetical protein